MEFLLAAAVNASLPNWCRVVIPGSSEKEVTDMKTIVVRDLVCGELIAWDRAASVLSYQGALHYFCSIRCSKRFQHAPIRFSSFDPVLSGVS